jgi:hypothetical protein
LASASFPKFLIHGGNLLQELQIGDTSLIRIVHFTADFGVWCCREPLERVFDRLP